MGTVDIDYVKMGTKIRQVRKEKGWTQNMLAENCGISAHFLGHIERGARSMSLETFVHICRALEVNADELLWDIPQLPEAVIRNLKNKQDDQGRNNYAMYLRIVKSVADAMNEA